MSELFFHANQRRKNNFILPAVTKILSCFEPFDDSDNDSGGAFEPQPSVILSLKVHGNSRKRLCSRLEDDELI